MATDFGSLKIAEDATPFKRGGGRKPTAIPESIMDACKASHDNGKPYSVTLPTDSADEFVGYVRLYVKRNESWKVNVRTEDGTKTGTTVVRFLVSERKAK